MKTEIKRRDFVTKCFKAGVTGCALLYGNSLLARDTVNQGQAGFETVKYFALLPRDFTEAYDELTPSLKKKRRVIARHFQDVIDGMYSAHKKSYASR